MNQKLELAKCIEEAFKEEFLLSHLSKNLIDTMKIEVVGNNVEIDIPAMKYNITKFKKNGVIQYYYRGSYAQQINETGGFSGKHKDYIDRCIEKGIQKWLAQRGKSGRVSLNE